MPKTFATTKSEGSTGSSQWDDVTGGIRYVDGFVGIGITPTYGLHVVKGDTLKTAFFSGEDASHETAVIIRATTNTNGSTFTNAPFQVQNSLGTTVAYIRQEGGVFGTYMSTADNATVGLTQSNGGFGIAMRDTAIINWSSAGAWWGTKDTGLSRSAANKIAVGNGTQGDYSGTLIANSLGLGVASPARKLDVRGSNATATTAAAEIIAQFGSTDATPLALRIGIKTDANTTTKNRYAFINVDDNGTGRPLSLNAGGRTVIGAVTSDNSSKGLSIEGTILANTSSLGASSGNLIFSGTTLQAPNITAKYDGGAGGLLIAERGLEATHYSILNSVPAGNSGFGFKHIYTDSGAGPDKYGNYLQFTPDYASSTITGTQNLWLNRTDMNYSSHINDSELSINGHHLDIVTPAGGSGSAVVSGFVSGITGTAGTETIYAFLALPTGGTLNYGFYQDGASGINYFRGKLGIGEFASNPAYDLDVDGDINATAYHVGASPGVSGTKVDGDGQTMIFTNGILVDLYI